MRWTPEMDAVLLAKYRVAATAAEIAALVGAKSRKAVVERARRLRITGARPPCWTREMDTVVAERYGTLGAAALAVLVGKSKNSVIGRAYRLGLAVEHGERVRRARSGKVVVRRRGLSRAQIRQLAEDFLEWRNRRMAA